MAPSGEPPESSETQLLATINGLLAEMTSCFEELWGKGNEIESSVDCYSKQRLNAFLVDAQRFDVEFTKHEAEAQRLVEAGYPAARAQLATIQHELQQWIAALQEALHLREALNARFGDPSASETEKEAALLRQIEEIYFEFCRSGQAFRTLCLQYSYGPPAAILEGHWQHLEEMESRFAQLEGEADELAAADLATAKKRLLLVREDLAGTIAIVKKMYASRTSADLRASELEAAAQSFAESMQQMNEVLSRARVERK